VVAGKTLNMAKTVDITGTISCIRYYAGWADKIHGQTIEVRLPAEQKKKLNLLLHRLMRTNLLTPDLNLTAS
jgi:acyl-CoA reductase-like NAD-dependent aldehyde dehydrogenase